jgi:hypothetical protein
MGANATRKIWLPEKGTFSKEIILAIELREETYGSNQMLTGSSQVYRAND